MQIQWYTFCDLPRTGLPVLIYNQKWYEIFKRSEEGPTCCMFSFFGFASAAAAVAAAAALPPPLLPIYLKYYRA